MFSPVSPLLIFGIVFFAFAAIGTIVYSLLGRHLLEICRTKQNFLAAPPLINKPFEALFQSESRDPFSMDMKDEKHPKKTGGMLGVMLLLWMGSAVFGIWYFAQYSWDKHPILLGICTVLVVVVFAGHPLLSKRMKSPKDASLLTIMFFLSTGLLIVALEYIEFGGLYLTDMWTETKSFAPQNAVRFANMTMLIITILHIFRQLCVWDKARREEHKDKQSGKEALLCEAISRFDPATMIADEPEVAAKPFPRRWIWIIGLYAAAIVVLWCVGVLLF